MSDQPDNTAARRGRGRPRKPGGAMQTIWLRIPPETMQQWKAAGKDTKALRQILVDSIKYLSKQV